MITVESQNLPFTRYKNFIQRGAIRLALSGCAYLRYSVFYLRCLVNKYLRPSELEGFSPILLRGAALRIVVVYIQFDDFNSQQ